MTTQTAAPPAPASRRSRGSDVDHARSFARRARRSDLLVVALWSSGAVAAALFLASGGVAGFGSPADAVTSLGVLAGLLGMDFVLVMLVLAARIPLIDRTIGHDRAIAVHRRLGKPALWLLLAHGALLLVGYGMSEGLDPIAEIGSMLALPDMPLAVAGLGLMVVVVVTSLVAVRRRFSYEAWHVVHLLSYAAVAIAIPHQFSVGGVLAQGTAQQVYWIALIVLAFGSILTFRVVEPLVSTLRHRISVAGTETIAPGVTSIHLRGRDLRALGSSGGQFFIWRFWTGRTWWHSHPLSLSSMPTDRSARITVRDLGNGSRRLRAIPAGTRVSIEGPYGLFTRHARTSPKLAVVAAGVGVTPIRALLEDARLAPGEATVLLRAGREHDAFLWDEVRALAAAKGAAYFEMLGHRAGGTRSWMSQDDARRGVTLLTVFPDLLDSDLYLCGPSRWLDSIEAEAVAAGLRPEQIHAERFDW